MDDLRTEFSKGNMPSGCQSCWDTEAAGKISKRQNSNKQYERHLKRIKEPLQNPVYLDLKLGTVCNLKCRSCSSVSSSKWVSDEIKIMGKPYNSSNGYWIETTDPLWNELENILPDIEHFDFTGGEPFLVKRHFNLLEKCVEKGYAKDITIHYNTNGTVEPTDRMFELWDQFKSVDVMFSIDGIDKKFEYLRHPGKWEQLESNFRKFINYPRIYTSICYSVTVFNVVYMNEFINWFLKHNLEEHRLYFNLIWNPEYLNIQSMSNTNKEQIKNFLENTKTESDFLNQRVLEVVNFMFDRNLQLKDTNEFSKITKQLDTIRGESFSETFPELDKILKL